MVECLGEYGVEVPLEAAMRKFCGISIPDCVRLVEREFDTSLPPDFGERYETRALQRYESELRAIPGVVEVPRGKPAPDLFLHAAFTMGVEPGRCVVIEDSIPGVTAARAAHMTAFGLVGSFSAHELEAAGARPVQKLEELLVDEGFFRSALGDTPVPSSA